MASSSLNGENTVDLGDFLSVLDPVGENAKRQGLRLCYCFVVGGSVNENPGKISYLADPTTIVLALDLNRELAHRKMVQPYAHRTEIPPSNVSPLTRALLQLIIRRT